MPVSHNIKDDVIPKESPLSINSHKLKVNQQDGLEGPIQLAEGFTHSWFVNLYPIIPKSRLAQGRPNDSFESVLFIYTITNHNKV